MTAFANLQPRPRGLIISLCQHMADGKYTEFYVSMTMTGGSVVLTGLAGTPQIGLSEAGYIRFEQRPKGSHKGSLRARARDEYADFRETPAGDDHDAAEAEASVTVEGRNAGGQAAGF